MTKEQGGKRYKSCVIRWQSARHLASSLITWTKQSIC